MCCNGINVIWILNACEETLSVDEHEYEKWRIIICIKLLDGNVDHEMKFKLYVKSTY